MDKDIAASVSAAWLMDHRRVWSTLLKVPHKVTKELVPFKFNSALDYMVPRLTGRDYVLKSRQLYITTYFQLCDLYTAMMEPNFNSLLFTDKDDEAKLYHDKYLFFFNQFPEIIEIVPKFPVLLRPKLLTDNISLLEFQHDEGNSYLRISSARSNIVGRGITLHSIHFPEFAVCEDAFARQALASALGAASPTTKVKLETTALGGGRYAHELWMEAKVGNSFFHPIFLPWTLDDTARLESSTKLVGLSDYEMKVQQQYGDSAVHYYRWAQVKFKDKAKQECAEDDITCFLVSGSSVFDQSIIEEYLTNAIPALKTTEEQEVFQLFRPGSKYVLGVDCMEGLVEKGDYHSIIGLNAKTLEVVFTYRSRCSIPELVQKTIEFYESYGHPLVVPERNSYGAVFCQYLQEAGCRRIYQSGDSKIGWLTTRTSKPLMIESLKRCLSDRSLRCYSRRIWEEARTFSYIGTTTGAVGRFHDDLLMGLMLALMGVESDTSNSEFATVIWN